MRRFPRLVVEVLSVVMPLPAVAAPFCVYTEAVPPQCIYFDPGSCSERARQLKGECSANPDEMKMTAGLGHYCLVTAGASMCIYVDRNECNREAQRQRAAACVEATGVPESPAVDPFRLTRPPLAGYAPLPGVDPAPATGVKPNPE